MNKVIKLRTMVLLLLATVLASCSSLPTSIEKPSVKLTSIAPKTGANGNIGDIQLEFNVLNPNNFDISLSGITFDVKLNDKEVFRGESHDLPLLRSNESVQVYTDAHLSFSEILALGSLISQSFDRPIEYELHAELETDYKLIGNIPVERKGKIKISDLLFDWLLK